MTKYAIVKNDTPQAASNNAIVAHVEAQMPGQHTISAILSWPQSQREALGVYAINNVRPSLEEWQRYDSGVLSFDNNTVTRTYGTRDIDLTQYKTKRVTDAWAHVESLLDIGQITMQSDTANTPVDNAFQTDQFTQKVFNDFSTAVHAGVITTTCTLTPHGAVDAVTFTVDEFNSGAATM